MKATTLLGLILLMLLIGGGALVVASLPEIKRYMKMRAM